MHARHENTVCLLVAPCILLLASLAQASQQQELEALYTAYERYETLTAQGDLEAALPEAESAYTLGKKLFGAQSEDTANLAYNYAINLVQLQKFEPAREVLTETLDGFERIYGARSVELLPVLMALGNACANTGDVRGVKKHYGRALQLSEKNFGAQSANHGWNSVRAGADMLNLARETRGRKPLRDGYDILRKTLGETDARTGYAAYHLGIYELDEGDFESARDLLLAAEATFADPQVPASAMEVDTHLALVTALEELGDSAAATRHLVALGRATPFGSVDSYQPVYGEPPKYPELGPEMRVPGYVVLEYSVGTDGFAKDPVLVELEGHPLFEAAALESARTLRYVPRFVDGAPAQVEGVQYKFNFDIVLGEQDCDKLPIIERRACELGDPRR